MNRRTRAKRTRRQQAGISYAEVVAAMLILSLTAMPALDALTSAMQSAGTQASMSDDMDHLSSRLEELLTEPYASLSAAAAGTSTASSYSDSSGATRRRLVFIAAYDGDNADTDDDPFTGTDSDILWLRVELENTRYSLQALRTDL